jgi:hypothetical protein
MTIEIMENRLKEASKLSSLNKATEIKQIIKDFQNSTSISIQENEVIVKRLKKAIYTIRMELVFCKQFFPEIANIFPHSRWGIFQSLLAASFAVILNGFPQLFANVLF